MLGGRGSAEPLRKIDISYDRNRATNGEILLAKFSEDDIAAKKLVGQKSELKMLISKLLRRRRANESYCSF